MPIYDDKYKCKNIYGGINLPIGSRFPMNQQIGSNESNPKQHSNIYDKMINNNLKNNQKLDNKYNNEKFHRVQTAKLNQGFNIFNSYNEKSIQQNSHVPSFQNPSLGKNNLYFSSIFYQNRPEELNPPNRHEQRSGKNMNYNYFI